MKQISEKLAGVCCERGGLGTRAQYHPGSLAAQKVGEWSRRLSFGLSATQFGSGAKFDTQTTDLPSDVRLGAGYTHFLYGDALNFAVDAVFPKGGNARFNEGVEFWIHNVFALRGGFVGGQDAGSGVRAGAGFRFQKMELNYAWTGFGDALGNAHRISFDWRFGRDAQNTVTGLKEDLVKFYLSDAQEDLSSGAYHEAVIAANRALEIDPGNPQALQLLTEAGEKMKKPDSLPGTKTGQRYTRDSAMSFSANRFPRRLLILTIVPLIALGVTLIVVTALQLRSERRARRENALDQTAAQIADQVKAWGESVRVAALAADVDLVDSSRSARLLGGLLTRFPEVTSVELFDAAGRRTLEQRRVGVLSLPDFSLSSDGLRSYVRNVNVWMAPLHFHQEGSPRLPFVAALESQAQLRGFLVVEFQTNAIETLLKRAALPMILTQHAIVGDKNNSRQLENLGMVLSLHESTNTLSGLWLIAGLVAILFLFVFITGLLERRWSRRAAEDIAHRERLMTIGATASAIGHELRTALAVIRNAVDALKIRADLSDPRAAKHADAIENQVRLGNRLLSDLLEFARPRSSSLKSENIHPLIEDVVAVLNLPRAIRVETSLLDAAPLISLDADKMRQVLANLILNAADAMPHGGELKISTRQTGKQMVIEILDSGAGMTLAVQRRLFEPFFSTKARGLGLGLSIVKKIIDAHSGHIRIQSFARNRHGYFIASFRR